MKSSLNTNLADTLHDPSRLAALNRTALLDSPAEEAFDRLTRLASRFLRAPIALVSLVDDNRQFFKSCAGLPEPLASERETSLSYSFCQHAVESRAPLIISDVRGHPLVGDNLAISEQGIVAYAGIPLITADGHALGSFCVLDMKVRAWTDEEVAILGELAASAVTEIELRLKTQQAEQALQAHDELLAMISHDLKNPVSVIRAYVDLLQRWLPPQTPQDVERLRKSLERIGIATTTLTDQIDELLDIAHVQADRPLDLQCHATDLVALARQVVADQQGTTRYHDIVFEAGVTELIGVYDAARTVRMLTNLLANGIKYSPSGGEVRVAVTHESDATGSWAVVRVQDEGLGIPAADLPHIFERFHRARNVAGSIAGTGLGLAGAKQIVEQHSGTINIASVEDKGTTVTVRLPLPAAGSLLSSSAE